MAVNIFFYFDVCYIKIFLDCSQIEVETVDRSGTFLGSLWESESDVAVTLLEHGLAKLQTPFNADKITNFHQLAHAEQSAKRQKLKVR